MKPLRIPGLSVIGILLFISCSRGTFRLFNHRIYIVTPQAADISEALGRTIGDFSGIMSSIGAPEVRVFPGAPPEDIPKDALVFYVGRGSIPPFVSPEEVDALPAEGFIVRSGTTPPGRQSYAAVGRDLLGEQYAVYDLLEEIGVGFFHMKDTYIPGPSDAVLPADLGKKDYPRFPERGMHLHTQHPIELMDTFLVPTEEHLTEAEEYVDFLVKRKQNQFEWYLLTGVDLDPWLDWSARLIEYAHMRGVKVGIVIPYVFRQQHAYTLIDPSDSTPALDQIDRGIDRIFSRARFDIHAVEMGSSEFTSVSDLDMVTWMDHHAQYLTARYPGVRLRTKIHVSTGQAAQYYTDVGNFNFVPTKCIPGVGVMPHTVQFYDLFRSAPTYGNTDFSAMRSFLLGEIGKREVIYYPETAYWVSFDIDVPLFLPEYAYSRWNDLRRLSGSGMQGQMNFSSGFEWGYWLNELAAAESAWNPDRDFASILRTFTRIFGPEKPAMTSNLLQYIGAQSDYLLERNLIAYLIGWDTSDEVGALLGIYAQPVKKTFQEIYRMDPQDISAFEEGVVRGLEDYRDVQEQLLAGLNAIRPRVPEASRPWLDEIADGMSATLLRTRHAVALARGVIARRKGELGMSGGGEEEAGAFFSGAQALSADLVGLVRKREKRYRFPVDRIARKGDNLTCYPFGYLYTASNAYYLKREETQAMKKDFNPLLMQFYNAAGCL